MARPVNVGETSALPPALAGDPRGQQAPRPPGVAAGDMAGPVPPQPDVGRAAGGDDGAARAGEGDAGPRRQGEQERRVGQKTVEERAAHHVAGGEARAAEGAPYLQLLRARSWPVDYLLDARLEQARRSSFES